MIFNSNFHKAAVFFDIEMTIYRDWCDDIFHKMQILDIAFEIIKNIEYFLPNRIFASKIDNKLSTERSVPVGVLQGLRFSSTLSKIFINNIPTTQTAKISIITNENHKYVIFQLQK